MIVSIEVPVFHHHYLEETIQSVLIQSYQNWKLLLLSDGATNEAQEIMRRYQKQDTEGRIEVHFQENQGIYRARKKLTSLSTSELILPLDHDDLLHPTVLEEMVKCFKKNDQLGLLRARRNFIDEKTQIVDQMDWFPFTARSVDNGMTTDVFNQSQPYMFRRSAYNKTEGWSGFTDFAGAGEDCDIFLKIEEVSTIELLDKVLYSYRLSDKRTSHEIGLEGAKKMWCELTDQAIKRRGLKLKRTNDMPPFSYIKTA